MPKTRRPSATPRPPPIDSRGNQIHNELLLGLSDTECGGLFSKLEYVRLKVHHVLYEPGDALKSVYFCNSGMISILPERFPRWQKRRSRFSRQRGLHWPAFACWFPDCFHAGGSSTRCHRFPGEWRGSDRAPVALSQTRAPAAAVFTNVRYAGHADRRLQPAP